MAAAAAAWKPSSKPCASPTKPAGPPSSPTAARPVSSTPSARGQTCRNSFLSRKAHVSEAVRALAASRQAGCAMHRLRLDRPARPGARGRSPARSSAPRPKSLPPMLRTPPKPKRPSDRGESSKALVDRLKLSPHKLAVHDRRRSRRHRFARPHRPRSRSHRTRLRARTGKGKLPAGPARRHF